MSVEPKNLKPKRPTRRKIDHVDLHVARSIKTLRQMRGLSQKELGRRVGVTFQQIQKYEKGTNRIGAGQLYNLACALNVSVGQLFYNLSGEAVDPFHGFDKTALETLALINQLPESVQKILRRTFRDVVKVCN